MYFDCGLIDPVTEECDLSVDPRVSLPATAESPGHEATEDIEASRAGEGAATVSLTGILPGQSSSHFLLLSLAACVRRRDSLE